MQKIIFLDRDGVINQDREDYVLSEKQMVLLPNAGKAINLLNERGYAVYVVTNQSIVGRQMISKTKLNEIHKTLEKQLSFYHAKISGYYICYHTPQDNCFCRKPKPGLLIKARKELGISARERIYFIGDKISDIITAKRAHFYGIKVRSNLAQNNLDSNTQALSVKIKEYNNLYHAVKVLLQKNLL